MIFEPFLPFLAPPRNLFFHVLITHTHTPFPVPYRHPYLRRYPRRLVCGPVPYIYSNRRYYKKKKKSKSKASKQGKTRSSEREKNRGACEDGDISRNQDLTFRTKGPRPGVRSCCLFACFLVKKWGGPWMDTEREKQWLVFDSIKFSGDHNEQDTRLRCCFGMCRNCGYVLCRIPRNRETGLVNDLLCSLVLCVCLLIFLTVLQL